MHIRETFAKFFADRGTHLAAMIAYFALLSFVPLLFLALALLGLSGRANESSYFVTELQRIFPGASISSIVSVVRAHPGQRHLARDRSAAAFLLWSSLSLFSVLESAFNIVYGRPNRPFLHGKALAVVFMLASLVTLFAGLLVGGLGAHLLNRFAPGFLGNGVVAYVLSIARLDDRRLPLPRLLLPVPDERGADRARDVLPGAIVATVALEATLPGAAALPRLSKHVPAALAFGGPALLLIWLYVMANVIVFGAEVNWRRAQR